MKKEQKPEWITDEQWEANPNIYHWEQSRKALESLKQLQNLPSPTREQIIQQQRQACTNSY